MDSQENGPWHGRHKFIRKAKQHVICSMMSSNCLILSNKPYIERILPKKKKKTCTEDSVLLTFPLWCYLHPTCLPADVCQEQVNPVFFQHLLWRRTGNIHKICFTETFKLPWEEGDGIPTPSAEGSGAQKSHVLVDARTRAWTQDFPILQHAASIRTCETSGCSQGIIFGKESEQSSLLFMGLGQLLHHFESQLLHLWNGDMTSPSEGFGWCWKGTKKWNLQSA